MVTIVTKMLKCTLGCYLADEFLFPYQNTVQPCQHSSINIRQRGLSYQCGMTKCYVFPHSLHWVAVCTSLDLFSVNNNSQ